jgi:hypothetical protein
LSVSGDSLFRAARQGDVHRLRLLLKEGVSLLLDAAKNHEREQRDAMSSEGKEGEGGGEGEDEVATINMVEAMVAIVGTAAASPPGATGG